MAKKKTHKKQSFKYAQPTQMVEESSGLSIQNNAVKPTSARMSPLPTSAVTTNDNPYLSQDLTRLGVIAIVLIVVEFVLWYAFGHTSLGSTVYNLYKIH